ncbi:MAG: putative phage abortive infection protein [Planctomycetes bacterium]|nr:putative phage abortive infection protein [Planctomycetota bacterium]
MPEKTEAKAEETKPTRATALLIVGGAVVTLLLCAVGWGAMRYFGIPKSAGEFGDTFGAANALFSGMAFLGIIVAIFLQKRELELQRQELELTRGELARQSKALELQGDTFRQQNFDATFFQMLSLHHQIVAGIKMGAGDQKVSGRGCFILIYRGFGDKFTTSKYSGIDKSLILIKAAYEEYYDFIQPAVGHYFRNLYTIVKFVDRSDVNDKQFYTNLIRAQLSSHELLMLFYNCAAGIGRAKFKRLVERYAILKHVPFDSLLDPSHDTWFESEAYSSSAAKQEAI